MLEKILAGVSAGILISIGGTVFLSCENRVAGAVFFSVALLCICYKGYSLFTGRVGYLPEKHDREAVSALLWGLAGNAAGTLVCGLLIRYALPAAGAAAEACAEAKLAQLPLQTLIRAFFCGVLMYLAVSIFRDSKTPLAILFGIPAFILSGFEHSIADMFYLAAAAAFTWRTPGFLCIVLIGNALGAMILPALGFAKAKRA